MISLYSLSEIRGIERAAIAALPSGTLMRRAAHSAANLALSLLPMPTDTCTILVLAGPGNNGGDALEVAALLSEAVANVSILLYGTQSTQSEDTHQAWQRAQQSAAYFADTGEADHLLAKSWDLIIDGLFGIGLNRAITGNLHELVSRINHQPCPVLALDIPSGLNPDTGNVIGQSGIAIRASHTISFIADKPGLHTADGMDHARKISIATLDIDPSFFPETQIQLNEIALFGSALKHRPQNSHKGSYGDVAIVGGATGTAGAAILAARAAAKSGAGKTFVAFVESPPSYDSLSPELMCRLAIEFDFTSATLVVGPGLGQSAVAEILLGRALNANTPLVLDADALNLIAASPALQQRLINRTTATLLTPHPLEAARLLATSSAEIQDDRIRSARELAQRYQAVIVLKGSGTIIANPDGRIVINTTGGPALATAGTGDVLAGICGALLAQHWAIWEAALAAVWLHGSAADSLTQKGIGPIGLTAGELIPEVRSLLNKLVDQYAPARGAY